MMLAQLLSVCKTEKERFDPYSHHIGFPGCSVVKNPPANAGDMGSIPRSGRYPGEGNVNPLQYSCLENPMDRGAWRATVSIGLIRVGHD